MSLLDFVDSWCHIVAKHSGKCLDVAGKSTKNSANVEQYSVCNGDNQKWKLEAAGDGFWYIIAKHSGKCLDVAGKSVKNSANVEQYRPCNGDNQKWRFQAAEDGFWYIIAKHSDKCLDVAGKSVKNCANVQQYSLSSGHNQQWKLVKSEPRTDLPAAPVPPPPATSESTILPLPAGSKYHVFLSHDWGINNHNHTRVSALNDELKTLGLVTWFDEERLSGDSAKEMAEGIDDALMVVVCITKAYEIKVSGNGERGDRDNCYLEFSYVSNTKNGSHVIPVLMDGGMRDVKAWRGKLQMYVGGKLYIEYCDDVSMKATACAKSILDRVVKQL
eukprot:GFYU01026497.1.p1 GENE.GFYU01026497.1~~GFYU01026497.1.p1  ORF type:complete len:330 (-),score=48.06 GFYU01026497.1:46-1035(-)